LAGTELGAVARWLQQAPVQHEAALARALAVAPAPYFEGPVPGEGPLSAAAAAHGFGSGRHLTADELAARRPDGYKVGPLASAAAVPC
jgi:hypothetical protein